MKKYLASALALAIAFAACKSPDKKSESTTAKEETPAPSSMVKPQAQPVTIDGNNVIVALTGDDQMKYNINEIKAKEGQTIKLTLTNIGKLPKESMSHNFILVKPGVVLADFAKKALDAKAADYFPESEKASVIIHTKMLGPGESDTIEFAAPAAGTYDYFCSFPGHYAIMNGKLIVEK